MVAERTSILPVSVRQDIAKKASITDVYLYYILTDSRRPSWDLAIRLSKITKTDPAVWMNGPGETIVETVKKKMKLN
jgi:plasmid maintenance system antidote protein VapI